MAVTNFESSVRTVKLAVREGYEVEVDIKRLNTGSYKYLASATYSPQQGIMYTVRKWSIGGKRLGQIVVDRVSNYGIEFNSTQTFTRVPDSLKKAIIEFHKAIS